MSSQSERALAIELNKLRQRLDALERSSTLRNASLDGAGLPVYDTSGLLRQTVGLQSDGTYTTVDKNAPAPPRPAIPGSTGRAGLLVVTTYGATADGTPWPLDFARLEVHVSTSPGFTVTAATKVAEFTRDGGSVAIALDAGHYFAALVAVNTSGVVSAKSDETFADVLPAVTTGGITTYQTDTEPVGLGPDDAGALWYDTNDGNRPYRWDGSVWLDVRDTTIAAARSVADQAVQDASTASNAAAAAQSDATSAAQAAAAAQSDATAASTAAAGAQTDADAAATAAAAAQSDADAAQQAATDAANLAAAKNRTYFQDTAPTSPVEGDVWYDTANGYHPKRWNATTSTWDDVQDQAIIDAANAASAADSKAAQAQTDATAADAKAVQAQADADAAATAASTADGKAVAAQTTADQAKTAAATADQKAADARTVADQAVSDAAAADQAAVAAQTAADTAQNAADAAQARADAVRLMGANLVYDGGFENDTDGKSLQTGGGTSIAHTVADGTAHGGARHFEMTRADVAPSYPGASFPIKFQKDRKYRTEFWARVPATVTAAQQVHSRINFKHADGTSNWPSGSPIVPNDNTWRLYGYDFTTEGDCTNLDTTLWVQHNGAYGPDSPVHIDDVALYDVTDAYAAQAAADAAQQSADAAQADATAAANAASAADAKAVQAQADADAAASAASAADAKAVQAQTDADAAATAASAADAKAVQAQTDADAAGTAASTADAKAVQAQSDATAAQTAADAADNRAAEAAALAGSKSKTWFQAAAPTSPSDGDIWYDTDDKYRPRRWNASLATPAWEDVRDQAVLDAADAAAAADAKAVQAQTDATQAATDAAAADAAAAAAQTAADTAQNAADAAQSAATAAQQTANQAVDDAATAKAIADGKITTFTGATAPVADAAGDLWIDGTNKLNRWSGSAWEPLQDAGIAQAIADASAASDAASTAQQTADRKVVTFSTSIATPPTADGVGDLWIVTDQGNKLKRWSGSAWVDVQDSGISQAITDAQTADEKAVAAQQNADAAASTAAAAQQAADDAAAAAALAQSTADGKIVTFYSDTEPVADGVGDLWIDTGNDNRQSRWSGTAWVPIDLGTGGLQTGAVTPSKMGLGGTGGGVFDNLVADMQFLDPNRRVTREAQNSNGAWTFRQVSNMTPADVANIGDQDVTLTEAQAAFTPAAGWHLEYQDPLVRDPNGNNHGKNSWIKVVRDVTGVGIASGDVICWTAASIPVTADEVYTAEVAALGEMWDENPAGSQWWSLYLAAQIRWFDSSGVSIGTSRGEDNNWMSSTRMQDLDGSFVQAVAPTGATSAKLELVCKSNYSTPPLPDHPWVWYLGRNGNEPVERNGWAMWNDTAEVWPEEWVLEGKPSQLILDPTRKADDYPYYSQVVLAEDIPLPRGAITWVEYLTAPNKALVDWNNAGTSAAPTGCLQGVGLVFKYADGTVEPPANDQNFDTWTYFSGTFDPAWVTEGVESTVKRGVTVDVVAYMAAQAGTAPAAARAKLRFPGLGIIGYNNSAKRKQVAAPDHTSFVKDNGDVALNLYAGRRGGSAAYDNILTGLSWVFGDSGESVDPDPNGTGDTVWDVTDDDPWQGFYWQTRTDATLPDEGSYNLRHSMLVNSSFYSVNEQIAHPNPAASGHADNGLLFLAGRNADFTPKGKVKLKGGTSPLELEGPGGVRVIGNLDVTGNLPALGKHADVADTLPADGDVLVYNASTGLWELVHQDPWHYVGDAAEPAYNAGFSGIAGYMPRFRKNPFGDVFITGAVSGSPASTGPVVFTLPAGYVPTQPARRIQSGNSAGTEIRLHIASDGQVRAYTNIGTPTGFHVDISFSTL